MGCFRALRDPPTYPFLLYRDSDRYGKTSHGERAEIQWWCDVLQYSGVGLYIMVLNDCYIHVLWNGGCLKFTVIPLYFWVLFCEWREQEKVIEGEMMSWGGVGCFPVPTHTYNWTPLAVCYYWKQLIGVVYCNWTGTGYMILSDYPVEDDIDTHPTSETKEKEDPLWRKVGWIGSLNGNARIHHTHTHIWWCIGCQEKEKDRVSES